MTRHALVVGCQTFGLRGADGDAALMADYLGARGFDVCLLNGPASTRDAIVRGYDALVGRCGQGDVAVFYFAGHGARWHSRTGDETRYLLPADFEASRDGEFRGLTGVELSLLLARLTRRTDNVVQIVDCCYAGGLIRDQRPQRRVRTAPAEAPAGIARHLAEIRAQADGLPATGNPHAVRLTASRPDESAYEYAGEDGRWRGVFTEALLSAIERAPGQVTWERLMHEVRTRVLRVFPPQRPQVEGPSRRQLFETVEQGDAELCDLVEHGGGWALIGGALVGMRPGDRYEVLGRDGGVLGLAEVVSVRGSRAAVRLLDLPGPPPDGAQARLRSIAGERVPIRVSAPAAFREEIESALAGAATLQPLLGESAAPVPALVVGGSPADPRIETLDWAGAPLQPPEPFNRDRLRDAVVRLRRLVLGQALREIETGAAMPAVSARLGLGRGGGVSWLDSAPLVLHAGDRFCLDLHNLGNAPVHVSVFDVGITGAIGVLTDETSSGVAIAPGAHWIVGERDGRSIGCELYWPAGVPAGAPRPESLEIVVTAKPLELGFLSASSLRKARAPAGGVPRALGPLAPGVRQLTGDEHAFCVVHVAFVLEPLPRDAGSEGETGETNATRT